MVAKKLTTSGRPLKSARLRCWPASVVKLKSGAGGLGIGAAELPIEVPAESLGADWGHPAASSIASTSIAGVSVIRTGPFSTRTVHLFRFA